MKKKSFQLFTKDVPGAMAYGKPEVVPAGGQTDSHATFALLEYLRKATQDAQVQAKAKEKAARDAQTAAKVDRIAAMAERIAARRAAPIPDAKNAGPSVRQLFDRDQLRAQAFNALCRESEAAYAARNPHRKNGGGQQWTR